jgi:uncharacterized protein (DUF305 family)
MFLQSISSKLKPPAALAFRRAPIRAAGVIALFSLGSLAACGGARGGPGRPEFPIGATGEAAAVARARADSLRYAYTAADIQFMSGMIHHHAQAIVMARWAPTHGASPEVQRLCERVVNAQMDEIALAQRWLRDRNQEVPEPDPSGMKGMKMKMGGEEHEMLMAGMLTEAQMRELDAARGQDFDRLFLTFMIQHHRGAVSMVKELFAAHGAGQDETIFKFASDVNVDQTTEINRMLEMLLSLGTKPPENQPNN